MAISRCTSAFIYAAASTASLYIPCQIIEHEYDQDDVVQKYSHIFLEIVGGISFVSGLAAKKFSHRTILTTFGTVTAIAIHTIANSSHAILSQPRKTPYVLHKKI